MQVLERAHRRPTPEIVIEQRKALFAAYRDVLSKPCPTQKIAWIRTVKHPAPRFYVTDKWVTDMFYEISNGNMERFNKLSPLRQQMYSDIHDVILRLAQKREYQGMSLKKLVSFAIRQPAPRFYIGWESMKKIFRNAKRYGIDYNNTDTTILNSQYTNNKDNKPKGARYSGPLMNMIT